MSKKQFWSGSQLFRRFCIFDRDGRRTQVGSWSASYRVVATWQKSWILKSLEGGQEAQSSLGELGDCSSQHCRENFSSEESLDWDSSALTRLFYWTWNWLSARAVTHNCQAPGHFPQLLMTPISKIRQNKVLNKYRNNNFVVNWNELNCFHSCLWDGVESRLVILGSLNFRFCCFQSFAQLSISHSHPTPIFACIHPRTKYSIHLQACQTLKWT